jgi:hypothetical protein
MAEKEPAIRDKRNIEDQQLLLLNKESSHSVSALNAIYSDFIFPF